MFELTTFSVVARCPRTGALGVAAATAVPAVGALCAHAAAGVGAIATQAWTNPYLGIDGLSLLREGTAAQHALERLLADDPQRAHRQLALLDASGGVAVFTGQDCTDWCGDLAGDGYCVQGNMLTGPETLSKMDRSLATSAELALEERLMRALEAGEAAGGDRRGRQSACLKVVAREAYPRCDLRIDDHTEPVAELRRILERYRQQLWPFLETLPRRDGTFPEASPEVTALLARRPETR